MMQLAESKPRRDCTVNLPYSCVDYLLELHASVKNASAKCSQPLPQMTFDRACEQ